MGNERHGDAGSGAAGKGRSRNLQPNIVFTPGANVVAEGQK